MADAGYGGTAKRVVEEWKDAQKLFDLPVQASNDLTDRIERAMLWAREGHL